MILAGALYPFKIVAEVWAKIESDVILCMTFIISTRHRYITDLHLRRIMWLLELDAVSPLSI